MNTPSRSQEAGLATLIVVSAVQFLAPFMMSSVGIALPAIGRELSANAVELGLVETVYILAVVLFLLPAGRLGDILGRKKIFIRGTLLFIAATLVIPFSSSIEFFILVRFFQGAGAAMIAGTSLAILYSGVEPKQRGKAMGIVVGFIYGGLSAGPVLGGFLVTHLGWQWIFYTALPLEITALILTLVKLTGEWAESEGEPFDFMGTLIYMAALSLLIIGTVNRTKGDGYTAMALAGLLGLGGFFCFEYSRPFPILHVRLLFSNRVFAFSNLATLINYAASFGLTFFLSLYLQAVKGLSPQAAGGVLIVQPIVQAILAPLSGLLSERVQPARISTLGMIVCALGLAVACTLGRDTPLWMVMAMLSIMGLGFALFSTPNMLTVMGSVEARHYGTASSLVGTMRSFGMLVSMTAVTAIVSFYMGARVIEPGTLDLFLRSLHVAFMGFSLLCLVGIFFSMARVKQVPVIREQEAGG
ncbi:MAG: MFS transporter [Desulfobacteraceae bacterium]|nr:MFS transporter [Desulfobacteraceae bacterium]